MPKVIKGPETLKVAIRKAYIWPDGQIGCVDMVTETGGFLLTFPQAKSLCNYLKDFVEHYHGN